MHKQLQLIVTACLCFAFICHPSAASQAGKEFSDADAELNDVYHKLVATIDDAAEKSSLVKAQAAWIKFRDENVALFAQRYPESKGGLFYNIHLTQERTAYLKSLLATPPSKDPQGETPSGY
jgi:uncharacterized protein YecT (DUF1311 family)